MNKWLLSTAMAWWVVFGAVAGKAAASPGPADSLARLLQQARAVPPGPEQVQALLHLSERYQATDSALTRRYGLRAVQLARQLRIDSLEANALFALANALYSRLQFEPALGYCRQALAVYQRLGMQPQVAECHKILGHIGIDESNFPAALAEYRAALRVHYRSGNANGKANIYNCIGNVYYSQDRHLEALPYFLSSLRLAEQVKDTSVMMKVSYNLAALYQFRGDTLQALLYYKRTLAIAEHKKDIRAEETVLRCLSSLGVFYAGEKKYALARHYLARGLRLVKRFKPGTYSYPQAALYYGQGELLNGEGRHVEAINSLRQAAVAFEQLQMPHQLSAVFSGLSEAYLAIGRLKAARQVAHKALALGRKHKFPFQIAEAYQNLATISAKQHDYSRAYRYQEQAEKLHDSLNTGEIASKMAEMQTRYETQKKEAQIALLRRNARLQRSEVQLLRRNTVLYERLRYAVGALLLIGLLYGAATVRNRRRQQRAIQLLQAQEREIASQNHDLRDSQQQLRRLVGDKEVLLKEVHHRVKNNLQIISSLLALQASKQALPQVKEVLREGQNWVYSIALIHEMLYRSDDLTRIEMQPFLERLTTSLAGTLAPLQSVPISCQVRAERVWLNTSTAVPVALMVNELVSNAYEHAFPAGRGGQVSISLAPAADAQLLLILADDGVGLPPGFALERATSLGLRLVNSLTQQLRGTLRTESTAAGTRFFIAFAEVREAALPT